MYRSWTLLCLLGSLALSSCRAVDPTAAKPAKPAAQADRAAVTTQSGLDAGDAARFLAGLAGR